MAFAPNLWREKLTAEKGSKELQKGLLLLLLLGLKGMSAAGQTAISRLAQD